MQSINMTVMKNFSVIDDEWRLTREKLPATREMFITHPVIREWKSAFHEDCIQLVWKAQSSNELTCGRTLQVLIITETPQ